MLLWILIICIIVFLCSLFYGVFDSPDEKYRRQVDKLAAFEDKFTKFLKNVTDVEYTFYKKIINKIKITDPSFWDVKRNKEDEEIFSITIGHNLCLNTLKCVDSHGRITYECRSIELIDKNGKCELSIIPPKEQIELYDLFIEYAIYKLELHFDKMRENESKKISEEHQKLIQEANSKFIL